MHTPRAARFLEAVLLVNIVVHLLAIAAMGLCLLPGMPGGPTADVADRAAYVAAHPGLWRLGWLPWHLCALVDILTGIALVCTPWVARVPALLTLAITLCAVVPEQIGELTWVTHGVDLAAQVAENPTALLMYQDLETWAIRQTVAYGASLYIGMALGWTWCFAAAGTWSRTLTWLSVLTWGTLAVSSLGSFLPEGYQPGDLVNAVSSGLGFPLLVVWLWLVSERVLARSRPAARYGRQMPWVYPGRGVLAHILDAVANSRVLRFAGEWLPTPGFRSDIRELVYVNYLVRAETLLPIVPTGLELQRVGENGQYAVVSVLVYHHGHFGPVMMGPLRRLMPSPVQTNWRIYVRNPRTAQQGIYFFTNAITAAAQALGARLFSEGMPMHVLAHGVVNMYAEGQVKVDIDPGTGSGPDLQAQLRSAAAELPAPWSSVWGSYQDLLAYLVPQDRALSSQPWYERITRQEIALTIPLESCQPLSGSVTSKAAREIVGDAPPLCFYVAEVGFRFLSEHHEPWDRRAEGN